MHARIIGIGAALLLAGCSTVHDPHKPRTVEAAAEGGEITVKHGQRLHIPLDAAEGYEWSLVEPQILAVMEQALPTPREGGWIFTPVRSGQETLKLEYRKLDSGAAPERSVSYQITVP